ncbi:MAG: triple tyrosine motif-containing protein [Winogradskyella sp.]
MYKLISYLFLISFLLYSYNCQTQNQKPVLTNFTKSDYNAGRQNWDIDIDENGIVYFGNSDGLLYNIYGEWGLKTLSKKEVVRALHVKNDTIWCGGNEYGFFTKKNGDFKFHSIGLSEAGPVWNIESTKDYVTFQSEYQIICYNKKLKSSVDKYYPRIEAITKWKDKIWIVFKDGQFGYLNVEKFIEVEKFNQLSDLEIRKIFVHNDLLYLVSTNGDVFNFNGSDLNPVNHPDYINKSNLFTGISYNDNSYCLGTISNGLIQLNNEGQIINKIDSNKGLLDNTVLSIKGDSQGNLWLGLDYGIAKIELESPVSLVFKGAATYDYSEYNNKIYIGTNKGLFESSSNKVFNFVEKSDGQIWKFKTIDDKLYICHNNGLFKVENNNFVQLESFSGFIDIAPFSNSPYYLLSTYNGLLFAKKEGEKFKIIKNLNIWGQPKLFTDNENGCIWVDILDYPIYKLTLSDFLEIEKKEISNILQVFETDQGLYFSDNKEIFEFTDGQFTTPEHPLLKELKGKIKTLKFNSDKKTIAYVEKDKIKLKTLLSDGYIHSFDSSLDLLSKNIIQNYETIRFNDNNLIIASDRNVKSFDINYQQNFTNEKVPVISSLSILNENNKKYYLPKPNETISLKKGNKDIRFNFSIAKSNFDLAEYRYKLDPKDNVWSSWSTNSSVLIPQVTGGDYTFHLQSKLNGGEEKNTTIIFTIEKFWYQTAWLILPIVIIISALIFGIIFIMNRIHRKKLQHQEDVYKRKHIQDTVAMKNNQLLQYTEIISHKNEFLNKLKAGLEEINSSKTKRWINLISKEVNNEKKEFLFHKLFSEVHQDFITKITKDYPTLTSNDVRMLSYIRVNLDKKEISNLMNISPRSVDMNRYRIRKKLNLDKGTNLNQFVRDY